MSTSTKRRKSQRRPPQKTTPRPQSLKAPAKSVTPVQRQTPTPDATPTASTTKNTEASAVTPKPMPAKIVQLPEAKTAVQEIPTERFEITGALPGKRRIRRSRKRSWPATVLMAESAQGKLHLVTKRSKKQMPAVTLCLRSSFTTADDGIKKIDQVLNTLKSFNALDTATAVISPASQDWTITAKAWEKDVVDEAAKLLAMGVRDGGEQAGKDWIARQNAKVQLARGAEKLHDTTNWLGAVALAIDDITQLSRVIQTALRKTDVDVVVIIDHDITVLIPATATDTDELTLEIAKLRLHLAGEHIHAVRVTDQRLLRHLAKQMGRPL